MTPWSLAAAVLRWQLFFLALGAGALLLTPLGLGWAVPVTVTAWLVGAWAGGIRTTQGRSSALHRPAVKGASVRVGAVWGCVAGGAYASLGLVPGALEVEGAALVLVTVVLGGIGAVSAGGLSLCGMDATSSVVE